MTNDPGGCGAPSSALTQYGAHSANDAHGNAPPLTTGVSESLQSLANPGADTDNKGMKAQPGDMLVTLGPHVDDKKRIGEITEVPHPDGSPPYKVRWQDGHEGLVFPGPDSHIEAKS